ncbi:MAG: ABC transporter ATP-binding protein [Deltaproteobacteria bacterium]|nr:ABC transporter ATP-binding protein [Deltaproteobacteria bacterium]
MLRVEKLAKSFAGFPAVGGADLEVRPGEVVAVIGPNGAGKTTLFNLIAGQLVPDAGRVVFQGEDIAGLPAHLVCRRGLARSYQVVQIFSRLTVFENVQLAVLARRRQGAVLWRPAAGLAREETRAILEAVGLEKLQGRLSGTLSHGDQKVLEMAIALGSRPRLLILDEPTAGMSPEETARTLQLLQELNRQGLTILFCEHDMAMVFAIADRIMVMHQGKTVIQGTPAEVRGDRRVQEAYLGAAEPC